MNPRLPLTLVLLFVALIVQLHAVEYVARTYTDPEGKAHPYRLLMPSPYDASQKYPVVVFFHGAGQRGDDNLAQIHNADSFLKGDHPSKFPCFVIALQVPHGQQWVNMKWSDHSGARPAEQSDVMKLAFKTLDSVTTEFSTDPDRIYLMGLSMGGYAVWDCITRFPDRFAAGIAVCGGGDESTVTPEVAKVPIWAFHSSDDPTVPVDRSRHMIEAMTKAGGHPHYTEYQKLGHGSWGKAFAEPQLFPWLFAQRRGQPDTTQVIIPPAPPELSPH